MFLRTLLLWLIGFFILTALGLVAAWWFFIVKSIPTNAYSSAHTVGSVLTQTNPSYVEAERLGKIMGNTATDTNARVELYQQALVQAGDNVQKGQIEYKVAVAYIQKGDYLTAIPILKAVAKNTSYTRVIRAYAVETLANMFYQYHDPKIVDQTFADAPYANMFVSSDYALSYRHVYEYASSFYPLDIAEARIADWYSSDILKLYQMSKSIASTAIQNDFNQVTLHTRNAQTDIDHASTDQNARTNIPGALLRMAVTAEKIAIVGLASKEDAERAYQKADQSAVTILGAHDPYWYFHYAHFLQEAYGASRTADIRATLAHLDNGTYTLRDPVIVFLKNERQNVAGAKRPIIALAQVDPQFKLFLTTIGWSLTDFQ